MERHVKERLVGAAVLVAAAVILIPEMLSGPDRDSDQAVAQAPGDAPLKTYTIDLTRSPAEQSQQEPESQAVPSTAAPPPEQSVGPGSAAAQEQVAESRPSTQANPESSVVMPESEAVQPPAPQASDPPKTVAEPASPPPAAPVSAGWAVQLGSFSSRATADGLEKKMEAQGYEAFVMPVRSGGATLYRVRIGPMQDRETAARTLARIKATVPAAAVVKHP